MSQAAPAKSVVRSQRAALSRFPRPIISQAIVIIAFLLLWEVAARAFGDPLFVAPLSLTVAAGARILTEAPVLYAIGLALVEIAIAYALAIAAGIALGLLIGMNRFVMETFRPILLMIYAIPQAPFLPFFVMLFGVGMASKVAYGFTHGVFVIAVNVIAGIRNIDERLVTAAKSMGASRMDVFSAVVFPTILRSLFNGARLGLIGVVLGIILAELYVTSGGIGKFTHLYTMSFRPPELFALASIVAIIAVTLNELARQFERRASLWRDESL